MCLDAIPTALNEKATQILSRTLNRAAQKYSTALQECLAVAWAVLLTSPYLEGHKFSIRANHDMLKWIFKLADASGELTNWRLCLSELEFDVVQRVGIITQTADALSQLETGGTDTIELDDDLPEMLVSLIDHRGKISDDRNEDPYLFFICQQCDDLVKTVNKALPR